MTAAQLKSARRDVVPLGNILPRIALSSIKFCLRSHVWLAIGLFDEGQLETMFVDRDTESACTSPILHSDLDGIAATFNFENKTLREEQNAPNTVRRDSQV